MKKCRRCSKPATLHITELHDGDVQALHLCESCAKDYLSTVDVGAVPDDADDLFQKSLSEVVGAELDELDQLVCPNCGISFKEFRNQGRLGCPHDYVVFEDELIPLLENIHGESQHTGKYPKRTPDSSRQQYELIRLRNQLRTAVETESYEEAAQLRDEIQTLETTLTIENETD